MAEKKTDSLSGVRGVGQVSRYRNTVLYGRSGTGKTTLSCTWPTPILLLDVRDEGTDSVSDVKGLEVKDINTFEEMEDTLFWLIRNPKKYKTVVIDTISQLQEILVEEVSAKRKKKSGATKRPGDWGTMRQQDWGQVAARMKSVIIDFRNLPMEVVFIAQDRLFKGSDEDEDSDNSDSEAISPEVGPQMMPSVAKVLNAAVTSIGNTFIRIRWVKETDPKGKKIRVPVKEYCLRIGPSATYVTKVRKPRSNIAPDYIIDPVYEDIVDIITGDYE